MNDWNETEFNQDEPYKAPQRGVAAEKKFGSCLLIGCLFSFVFILILVVGVGLSGYWFVKGQVNEYTADKPADFPIIEYSEEELAAILNRVEKFKETIENGETPEALVLTADELNALISQEDELRGKVYVAIQNGKVLGEVSIPTDFIPGGKGRYFNASATFNVSLDNGVLIVTLADATVKGEKVPQEIIAGIGKENLAKDIYKDPKVAEILRQFDSLTIDEGMIILTPRLVSNTILRTRRETLRKSLCSSKALFRSATTLLPAIGSTRRSVCP